jgi:hypothetical protein
MRGWRRIGIVLSVFWFVWFFFWLRQNTIEEAWTKSGISYCSRSAEIRREGVGSFLDPQYQKKVEAIDREEKECRDKAVAHFTSVVAPDWLVAVSDAISLAFLWLLGWIVVRVGRWVAAGFQQQA